MRRAGLLLCLALCACGFGHEVEQDGSYAIVPGTRVDDSALIPLERMLIIEQDLRIGQTRLYYFRGDLHGADLGLEDLRRIAARYGGFRMAFDAPRKFIEADEIESHGKPLGAHAGDDELELVRLDNEGLLASDAQRYLTSVTSNDYDVAAYFGVIDREGPLPPLSIDDTDVVYEPNIPSPQLGIKTEKDQLALDYLVNADYLVVELTQPITSHLDKKRELDALVRTSLGPGTTYVLTPATLTDVTGQGCWSRELPIELRLHQVVRHYDIEHAFAIIHDRIDVHELAPDTWTAMLAKPQPPAYCKEFQ